MPNRHLLKEPQRLRAPNRCQDKGTDAAQALVPAEDFCIFEKVMEPNSEAVFCKFYSSVKDEA